ncbi:MAG: DUF465 domain-containing protein [Betaproteobacteria bacterium]|nr:DUF465 domain-containing protein [Betaproteobacteria bacterium]
MVESEVGFLRTRIHSLAVEHHDLDAAIARMEESKVFADDELQRLKKKKLHLKDQIAGLERQLSTTQ